MYLLLLSLLLFFVSSQSTINLLNEFTGDVDYYDLGVMSRGKNAGTWHHSFINKYEVFYYLSMQPWRHFVWTSYDAGVWYTRIINEDASITTMSNVNQDYCRKVYGYPVQKFEIDWTRVSSSENSIETESINGITCFKYPAKSPLVNIYINTKILSEPPNPTFTVCRYDFIGGRSITFRSFNSLDTKFFADYNTNIKEKCIIDVFTPNLSVGLAIVYTVNDPIFIQQINNKINYLSTITNIKEINVYYFQGDKLITKSIRLNQLNNDEFSTYGVSSINADFCINNAKSYLISRIQAKSINKGMILYFGDRSLSKIYDANTDFDRNDISVFAVVYNPSIDPIIRLRAISLVSLGTHYFEIKNTIEVDATLYAVSHAMKANSTERCDRKNCNGFCDAKNRCTCPMCCENTCFYTYCDTNTGSCKPWPPANPRKRTTCANDCVGTKECVDLIGCVYKQYNTGCEPQASCFTPYCTSSNVCLQKDNCQPDVVPSSDLKCYAYKCNKDLNLCEKIPNNKPKCPPKNSLCEEYYCDASLNCNIRPKTCVKTAPYTDYDCFVATCKAATGQCENKLSCDVYSSCGVTTTGSVCTCNAATNYKCDCKSDKTGFCDSSKGEVCDYTDPNNIRCVPSVCKEDLTIENCKKKICDPITKVNSFIDLDCSKFISTLTVDPNCQGQFTGTCQDNKCTAVPNKEVNNGCGECTYNEAKKSITYTEFCSSQVKCGITGVCDATTKSCVFNLNGKDPKSVCADCLNLTCSKDYSYYTYTYFPQDGSCSVSYNAPIICLNCNSNNKVESACKDPILKVYVGINKKQYNYHLPLECNHDRCIPIYQQNSFCENIASSVGIKDDYGVCGNLIKSTFHYSSKFDVNRYNAKLRQTDDFYNEAQKEAYCIFELTSVDCNVCEYNDNNFNVIDKCPSPNANGIPFVCQNEKCIVRPDYDCKPDGCKINVLKGSECIFSGEEICSTEKKELENIRKDLSSVDNKLTCEIFSCDYECFLTKSIEKCSEYKKTVPNLGCRKIVDNCLDNTYICQTVPFENPEDERDYIKSIDSTTIIEDLAQFNQVTFDNICFNYTCVEKSDGTHYWQLDLSRSTTEANLTRRNLCEIAFCDKSNYGAVAYREITCSVLDSFKSITPDQARCFSCFCSFHSGLFNLNILPDTYEEHFELDPCGNCKVYDQHDRSILLNEDKQCILVGNINNSGAIAATTTVVVILVVLITAFTIFTISAVQTYRLVSSAFKNTINTTIDNPEFVEADNRAVNTNFNG